MMPKKPESKYEMIKRLTKRFEKLMKEKLPDEPGMLEETEKMCLQDCGRNETQAVWNALVSVRCGVGANPWLSSARAEA